jgi:DNA-binding LytR/AlgR family response regulator
MKDNFIAIQRQFVINDEIGIKERGNLELIHLKSILKFESDRNYTVIYLIDGRTVTSSRTLQLFEKILYDKTEFIRANRKELINLHHVTFSKANLSFDCNLNLDKVVRVSRIRTELVSQQVQKFKRNKRKTV